ncbi:hypothetical protein FQA39_LY05407 [Lamprigera yunnana]|nr:hypothetical protein FQA39_LY05407 [Lamprigera yunnana]
MILLKSFYILLGLQSAYCLKILGIFGHPGRSHFDVFKPLLIELSEKGHDVTVLGYFPLKEKIPRYKDVILKHPKKELASTVTLPNLASGLLEQHLGAYFAFQESIFTCNNTLASSDYANLLNNTENVDIIIAEFFVSNCLLYPFMEKFKAPVVGITSHVLLTWSNSWVGNIYNPSYVPSPFLKKSNKMTFIERVENTLSALICNTFYKYVQFHDTDVIKRHLNMTLTADMYNTSLILVNSHFSLHKDKTFVPNIIEVGGIHIVKLRSTPQVKELRMLSCHAHLTSIVIFINSKVCNAMTFTYYFILTAAIVSCASCLRILGVFPYTGRSHFIMYAPLLKEISRRGHEITVVSSFPLKERLPRYKDVYVPVPPKGEFLFSFNTTISPIEARIDKCFNLRKNKESIKLRCRSLLISDEYQNFLKSKEKFDLIVSEYFTFNCHLVPIIEKFKIPFILIQTTQLLPWVNHWLGNPNNPAYIPVWTMDYSQRMTFIERFENTVAWVYANLYYNYVLDVQERDLYLEYANQGHVYPDNIMYNASLILINSHFTLHGSRPLVPNIIDVGGIHIQSLKILPTHIDKWINESTHGVIYFSLGSMIKGHTFPEKKRQMFVNAFSRFPERVLWKWETNTMPGKPDNIMIEKWMPQLEILCHPNVKAFIAHGGLLGITEAVHCGVPLILIPQFGDQFTNAKAIEANGGGVILDYGSLDEESIYNALKTILDPRFNQQAKELSARFRDRPLPPLETAIYWVEYVARHKGAPHLRTAAVGMPLQLTNVSLKAGFGECNKESKITCEDNLPLSVCFRSTKDSADLSCYADIDLSVATEIANFTVMDCIHAFQARICDVITENDSEEEEIPITLTETDINAASDKLQNLEV